MSQVVQSYKYLVFSCILEQREDVETAMRQVLEENDMLPRFTMNRAPLDLGSVYRDEPPPGGAHRKVAVLFSPKNAKNLTVFVSNLQDGWHTMINCISKKLSCTCIRVTTTVDTYPYPVNSFEYVENGISRRSVSALKDDDGWKFCQAGEPLESENVQHYRRRSIADRLDRLILIEYLQNWTLPGHDHHS
jgi:hypothetical protein